jgi:murein DD-endopeptidase MepM/ murein hydrolase activator NlpD
VAGCALAAAGQHALVEALPATTGGANVLRLGVEKLLGTSSDPTELPTAAATVAAATEATSDARSIVAITPVETAPLAHESTVADATELVKAADLQREAVETTVRAEQARVAQDQAAAAEAAAAERSARTAASAAAESSAAAASEAAAASDVTGSKAAAKAAAAEAAAATAETTSTGGSVQLVTGRVTSGFGGRWGTVHQGIDIAAPVGTPIHVPMAGTVIDSGPASGFGLWVRVRHADGTITTYGHVNRSLVTKGEQVTAGQEIAEVGNRGHSTGPHLHIEVMTPAGIKINPRPWLDGHDVRY